MSDHSENSPRHSIFDASYNEIEHGDCSGNKIPKFCSHYTYNVIDLSGCVLDISSNSHFLMDNSGDIFDINGNVLYNISQLVDVSYVIIDGIGFQIVNKEYIDPNGNVNMHTTFTSTRPDIYDPDITENFMENVSVYDNISGNSETEKVMNEIIDYAAKIKCEDFHGKGTIDDYAALFQAASKIARETTQIQLDVNVDGFNEFGKAADDLASLFTNFTLRLQNVNIINDITFLKAISSALGKISNLSDIFGKFKQTIMCKSSIQLPKSSQDTNIILNNVMSEVNCAMNYISNFVEVTNPTLRDYELSSIEKNIISKAVDTIDNWKIICDEGVSITMSNNPAIVSINNNNRSFKASTVKLNELSTNLRSKLSRYIC